MRTARNAIAALVFGLIFQAARAATWYVATNGNDSAAGTNWFTAKQTIQAAIDLTISNDTVLVSNGVYATGGRVVYGALTNRVAITNELSIQSVNGPTVTIIAGAVDPVSMNGDEAIRCAYVGTNALLSGFTLTDGHTRTDGDDYSEQRGGAVWCEASAVVSNCTLSGNSAYSMGGGSYNGTLDTCVLSDNWAMNSGGGSYDGTLNNCALSGNWASKGGGSSSGTLNRCTLLNNAADWGGGSSGGTLNHCTISSNCAGGNFGFGGASSDSTLNDCTLSGNSAYNGGGSSGGTLSNCTIIGNKASQAGGGSYCSHLYNCMLYGNTSDFIGGGSYHGVLNNCALIDNTADSYGGGACGSTLNNCTLSGNTILFTYGSGGGSCYGTLNNCTLIRNYASGNGGGSQGDSLNNCIVYFNTARNGANYDGATFNYSCTTPEPDGAGNITNEPVMASAFHLSVISPCVGAGNSAYATGTDIDGESWATPPAMGCDEMHAGSITGLLSVAIMASYTNVTPDFVVDFTACITGRVAESAWDFGDGTVRNNHPYISHAFAATGVYPVVLTAMSDSYPEGVSTTTRIFVVAQQVYYVNISNETPAEPFATWATAATNIQDAIDVASVAGAVVLVSNGVYSTGGRVVSGAMTNRVAVTKAITVRSVNGPEVTTIVGAPDPFSNNGDAAVRCVYLGTNACLSGFTLTNGHTRANMGTQYKESNGGAVWCEASAVVSNCTLSGNSAYRMGGGSYYGDLNNCILSGNLAFNSGGGSYYGTLNNCVLEGNSAGAGGGSFGSNLKNCVLSGNLAYSGGGGACDGTLNNCLVAGNFTITTYGCGGGANNNTLNCCTLFGNSSSCGGGSASCMLNNCIVYFNTAPSNANYYSSTFGYSCTTPDPYGIGNITNDPEFADVASSNFDLCATSPCIDAGQTQSWMTNATDIAGRPRIMNAHVDMGASEFRYESSLKGLLAGHGMHRKA